MKPLGYGLLVVVAAAAVGPAAACGATGTGGETARPGGKSLYDRLGGMDAIKAVVHDFVANAVADPRIKDRFAATDIPHLEAMLDEQICEASGGPCKYSGKSMEEAHAGLRITDQDFDALVEDLAKSLGKFRVKEADGKELLSALGAMKPQIVDK
jgi:hemoglobin